MSAIKNFRGPITSNSAIFSATTEAHAPIYIRDDYIHLFDDNILLDIILEETGQSHDAPSVKLILSCIKHLKTYAMFESALEIDSAFDEKRFETQPISLPIAEPKSHKETKAFGLNRGYTINLN